MADVGWIALAIVGVAGIVWGAEAFPEHLGAAAVVLGVQLVATPVASSSGSALARSNANAIACAPAATEDGPQWG
jgi:hypothetical protein